MILFIRYIITVLLFGGITFWLYKWIFFGYKPERRIRTSVLLSIFLPLALFIAGSIADSRHLILIGNYWCIGLEVAVFMIFLEVGLSKLFKNKRHIFIPVSIILAISSTYFVIQIGYNVRPVTGLITEVIGVLIIVGLYLALYKRLITRFKFSEKHKGVIILSLWFIFITSLLISQNGLIIIVVWLHYFVFSRIHKGLKLQKNAGLALLVLFSIGFVLSFQISGFAGNIYGNRILYVLSGIWLGIISISFSFYFFEFFITLIIRRRSKIVAAGFLIIIIGVSSISVINGVREPVLKEVNIPVSGLGRENSGFCIIQLSDLHLGDLLDMNWFENIIRRIEEIDPDIVVMTGDIFEHDFSEDDRIASLIDRMDPEYGIFAVTGNHEYYTGIERFREIISKTSIKVLYNEKYRIGDIINIVGINDNEGSNSDYGGPDLENALDGSDGALPVVLLSHRPGNFEDNVDKGVDLQLSGHTHSGQIPPIEWFVRLYYKYYYGLYNYKNSYLYTSSGTGVWGMKMRFLSRSEIVKIILVDN
ncbi:metallophosphoesterase [candidate division KSB1 bacterium]